MENIKINNNLAPICLFVYNRLEHTKKTVEALKKNKLSAQSDLFIFSDGGKDEATRKSVENVRSFIKTITGFNKITIIEREKNYGLDESIIDGINHVFLKFEKIIVLEDDVITSPFFLIYMNEALCKYKDNKIVMNINGYTPPINLNINQETFFFRRPISWGWGTWRDSWKEYINNPHVLMKKLKEKKLLNYLDLDGKFRFSSSLRSNLRGETNIWDIMWHASIAINNGLCLYPRKSMVNNSGNDGSGIHCKKTNHFNHQELSNQIFLEDIKIEESKEALIEMKKFYKKIKPNIITIIIDRLIRKNNKQ